jgi:hypothetical protein
MSQAGVRRAPPLLQRGREELEEGVVRPGTLRGKGRGGWGGAASGSVGFKLARADASPQ